ncbi:MAG: TPM domain-containing protein [Oligoflexia bacterium]|nr:TPM domain-containing protein [Oligoflexia bacterium]
MSFSRRALHRCALLFALVAGAVSASPGHGREIPPPPRYYVLDEPGVLSPGIREGLQSLLVEHDHATGEQVLVAVFHELGSEDLVDWTNRVFSSWRIGQRGKDNGVLLALYWKDRLARIEVGYGLEPLLTDAKSKTVLSDFLIPELKAGNPDRALSLAALEILRVIESPLIASGQAQQTLRSGGFRGQWKAQEPRPEGSPVPWLIIGIIVLIVIVRTLTASEAHFTGSGWYRPRPTVWRRGGWGTSTWGGSPWPRGGGGWGGGGGFRGGGGSSGGGGASGNW